MGSKDLTGIKFGRLTVIKKYDVVGNGESRYLCNCDCGKKDLIVRRGNLKGGNTQSCGCLQSERVAESCKKYNKYEFFDSYFIGYASNTNEIFYLDIDDYEKIKKHCWLENDKGYIISRMNSKNILLHRFVMDLYDSNIILDHINLDKKDNRKSNIRISDRQLNGINRYHNKNNKLGFKGVSKIVNSDKYMARIMIDGKSIHLGCYDTIEQAYESRKLAEIQYFGEYSVYYKEE